jgi:hypothetical protein
MSLHFSTFHLLLRSLTLLRPVVKLKECKDDTPGNEGNEGSKPHPLLLSLISQDLLLRQSI